MSSRPTATARATARQPVRSVRSITDVYDEQRRALLVHFPAAMVVSLSVAGVVAFLITGFWGYTGDPPFLRVVFAQPWALYLWVCSLLLALEVAIFRDRTLRRWLAAILTVTMIAIVVVGILFFYWHDFAPLLGWLHALLSTLLDALRSLLSKLLNALLHLSVAIPHLLADAWLYTLLNFSVIAIYCMATARRWLRRAMGLPPTARSHVLATARLGRLRSRARTQGRAHAELPAPQELVAGDLIAGGVLTLLLALIFRAETLRPLLQLAQIHTTLITCTVSWPLGHCAPPGGGLHDPPTLSFIDLMIALSSGITGLLALALSATLSGFSALAGVNRQVIDLHPPLLANETGAESVSDQVTRTLLDTLRSAFDRRRRGAVGMAGIRSGMGDGADSGAAEAGELAAGAAGGLLFALRALLWPLLIVVGCCGAAAFARSVQLYLRAGGSAFSVLVDAAPAVFWLAVAGLAITLAAALLAFRWRVVENTLRLLGLASLIAFITLWIFSLAFWGFNHLLLLTHVTERQPFGRPGWLTLLSFVALAGFGVYIQVRHVGAQVAATRAQRQQHQQAQRQRTPPATAGKQHTTKRR
ncbi:MAG: hypothetical protein ABI068_13530 [Ktedonobacterales bacterium]